jgi:hypothetical protein
MNDSRFSPGNASQPNATESTAVEESSKMKGEQFDDPVIPQPAAGAGYQDSEFAFPFQVYTLLEDATRLGFESTVSWVQDGSGFLVQNREEFSLCILPAYFNQTRYKSFQRQLNFYQFERTTSGRYKGMS